MRLALIKWLVRGMRDKTAFVMWVRGELPELNNRRAHWLDRLDKTLQAQAQQLGI